jgi:hypothetical protein
MPVDYRPAPEISIVGEDNRFEPDRGRPFPGAEAVFLKKSDFLQILSY